MRPLVGYLQKAFGGGSSRDNPPVHSKGATFHGEPHTPGRVNRPDEQAPLSGGRQRADQYQEPLQDWRAPLTHHNAPYTDHKETVGWLNGVYHRPTHPNSDAKAAGGAMRTSRPLEPKMPGSAYGDESHQQHPEPQGNGGNASAHGSHGPHGVFNHPRDRNRGFK